MVCLVLPTTRNMLGLTELTRINIDHNAEDFTGTPLGHYWHSTGWASDRTGDRRATRHATGLDWPSVGNEWDSHA
jgi:hypothetical protein